MRTILLSALVFLLLYPRLIAQSNVPLSQSQIELIHTTINQFPNKTEFALAVIKGDKVQYMGIRKEKGKLISIDNRNDIFQIGSITKVFTTHLLLNLLHAEKIESLDEAVKDRLSIQMRGKPGFTFRQLANHSSGLPSDPANLNTTIFNMRNPYEAYSEEKFLSFLAEDLEMEAAPGTKYKYSNLGMTLLGYAITSIAGKDYETLLQEQIFQPIGMKSSSTDKNSLKGTFVQGFTKKGKPTPYWDFDVVAPAGAILSTTEDLSKYVRWNFQALGAELAPMKENTIAHTEKMDVALGWHIIKNHGKSPFLWHNGGTGGFKSSLALSPDTEESVIILTNVGRGPLRGEIDQLCFNLMKVK